MIRRCPNGETLTSKTRKSYAGRKMRTQGSKTFQYLVENKLISIPLVAASEKGTAQTCPSSLCSERPQINADLTQTDADEIQIRIFVRVIPRAVSESPRSLELSEERQGL